MDCGPACLRMVAQYYGVDVSLMRLRDMCGISRDGVSFFGLSHAASALGLEAEPYKLTADGLAQVLGGPCIVRWNNHHFMVVYRIKGGIHPRFYVADPARGFCSFAIDEFRPHFETGECLVEGVNYHTGSVLFFRKSDKFDASKAILHAAGKADYRELWGYLRSNSRFAAVAALSLCLSSAFGALSPLLMQLLVDEGVDGRNRGVVSTVIAAQFMVVVSAYAVSFLRSWVSLRVNAQIGVLFVSGFLNRLLRLPMPFFERRNVGDVLQRVDDGSRVQQFLVGDAFPAFFSAVSCIVMLALLAWWSMPSFILMLLGAIAYLALTAFLMERRKELDNRRYAIMSGEQCKLVQMVEGVADIKLCNHERKSIWEWESFQAKFFSLGQNSLLLANAQEVGGLILCNALSLGVTYLTAVQVVEAQMTFGTFMAIMYIVGQLVLSLSQLSSFLGARQDAVLSLERLGEVCSENTQEVSPVYDSDAITQGDIVVRNVSFSYNYPESPLVLADVCFTAKSGQMTAIVGASGCGKSSLVRLLLGLSVPVAGSVLVGGRDLRYVRPCLWRSQVGSVLQGGYIFSDTIAANIAFSDDGSVDMDKVRSAASVACADEFIDALPLGYSTVVGNDGVGLSRGQCQRLLIARMVYRNPNYVFLDEATNSLDAVIERRIVANLAKFNSGRTTIVVAHRLSTICEADNIVVLDGGRVVEQGTHDELCSLHGKYYELVRNQIYEV